MIEYQVVWQWREYHYTPNDYDYIYPKRKKIYKTRAAADRLLAKLHSNGGRFTKTTDHEYPSIYDDGLFTVHLILNYARLETREVGAWSTIDEPT